MGQEQENARLIRALVRRIVDGFSPDKIILFGSHARGEAGPDSDVDLLVVMPIDGSRRQLATEIERALVGLDIPVDLVVVTGEELERNRQKIGTVIRPAVLEGEVLYERAA